MFIKSLSVMFLLVPGYVFLSGHFNEPFDVSIFKWCSKLLAALGSHVYKL